MKRSNSTLLMDLVWGHDIQYNGVNTECRVYYTHALCCGAVGTAI
jgi:hypothetical protein